MLMRYSLYLFVLLLPLTLTYSCKKNSDPTKNAKLPAATQEGKNTIGFTINGEVWIPYYKCRSFGNPCAEFSARYGVSGGAAPNAIDFAFTRKRENKSSSLSISSSGLGTITTMGSKIDSIDVSFTAENWSGNTGAFGGPYLGGTNKFIVTKIDYQNQIISGEFELVLIEQNGTGNTITLKDGRFDFQFNACKCSN